jgi:hypothetical protein
MLHNRFEFDRGGRAHGAPGRCQAFRDAQADALGAAGHDGRSASKSSVFHLDAPSLDGMRKHL